MADQLSHRHLLAQLLELKEALQSDQQAYDDQLRRDRQIALDSNANTANGQLNAWLNNQSTSKSQRSAGRAVFSWHLVQLSLFALGVLTGIALSSVMLQYDGSQPINLIEVWLILVGLPFTLMLLWLFSILPFRLPGITFLSESIRQVFFQPLSQWLFKRLGSTTLSRWDHDSKSALLMSLSSSLMQWFGFGVAIASLLTTLAILASSDLAFVWSTSFDITETSLHQLTAWLSIPFSFWQGAEPSMELIQISHYYRLDETKSTLTNPDTARQLTQWWPFLVASIAVYSLLLRFLTLLLSLRLSHRAIQQEISALPGYSSLLARMNAPLVSTTSYHKEPVPPSSPQANITNIQFSLTAPVVNWGQTPLDQTSLTSALASMGFTATKQFQAGGSRSSVADQQTIAEISQLKPDGALILVRAWEPPLLEFKDWLKALRHQIDGAIVILLVDPDNSVPSEFNLLLWRDDLQSLADPQLYIEALPL